VTVSRIIPEVSTLKNSIVEVTAQLYFIAGFAGLIVTTS
jgi:hypothetical protein